MADDQNNRQKRYVYHEQLRTDLSPAEVQHALDTTATDLVTLGIEAKIEMTGSGSYAVTFNNEADFHLMADEMSRMQPQYHTAQHVEQFNNRSIGFEKIWIDAAAHQLREAGMDFQVEHAPGRSATFSFPTYFGQVMFTKLVETGWVDRAAGLHTKAAAEAAQNPDEPGF